MKISLDFQADAKATWWCNGLHEDVHLFKVNDLNTVKLFSLPSQEYTFFHFVCSHLYI